MVVHILEAAITTLLHNVNTELILKLCDYSRLHRLYHTDGHSIVCLSYQ